MKLMQPVAISDIPAGNDWVYEVKYDGFRCTLHWDTGKKISLTSRNNKDLTGNFPEVVAFCQDHEDHVKSLLPLVLDGEIAVLNNEYQANFPWIQKRGRLKISDSIEKAASTRPASFLAFDMLEENGISLTANDFQSRKTKLEHLFEQLNLNLNVTVDNRLCFVPSYNDHQVLWDIVFAYKGEGIVAKRKLSIYRDGKNHRDWFKIKNWRILRGILTEYDAKNDYFSVNVYEKDDLIEIGKCKHGLNDEEFATLQQLFMAKGEKSGNRYVLPPAICAEIHSLDLLKNELREPEFQRLLPGFDATACTVNQLQLDMAMIPSKVEPAKTDKVFWPRANITKGQLLVYLREISPYMLPFLQERALTLIRCPDGIQEEYFFQKHLPDYAPDYIENIPAKDGKIILCNNLETLIWFGNHGAIEYHVPFQQVHSRHPSEIVFDLDPPDVDRFPLAIQAATLIKELLDDLDLISFVKTSGNKGLQVYIPLPKNSMTYDETAVFTEAIAHTIENAYPQQFTTERLKKNRHERLYIDYVQHGKDKTIVAPYSPRKTEGATIATPLYWEEVTEGLTPSQFTMNNVVERVQTLGCPFKKYFEAGERQHVEKVKRLI